MTDFVLNNLESIISFILALAMLVYAVYTKQWGMLQISGYKLMLAAERIAQTKEGAAKMEAVYAALWVQIPKWIKKFVSEKTLREKLQEWYDLAKDSLGKANNKIKE